MRTPVMPMVRFSSSIMRTPWLTVARFGQILFVSSFPTRTYSMVSMAGFRYSMRSDKMRTRCTSATTSIDGASVGVSCVGGESCSVASGYLRGLPKIIDSV